MEISSAGCLLGMAVPGRATGTLCPLSILQTLGQDFAKSFSNRIVFLFYFIAFSWFALIPTEHCGEMVPPQHFWSRFPLTSPLFTISHFNSLSAPLLPFTRVRTMPCSPRGWRCCGWGVQVRGCNTALPASVLLEPPSPAHSKPAWNRVAPQISELAAFGMGQRSHLLVSQGAAGNTPAK